MITDIVARDPDGRLLTRKRLSENPEDYADAAVAGIRDCLGLRGDEPIATGTIAPVKMSTTVATEALLERKGERVLLLITEGFRDLLRIGTQARPALFDWHIWRPDLLYERVEDVPGRLDADGEEARPLDEGAVRRALADAHAAGIRAVAVALMHGHVNPAHELPVGEIAAEIGYSQVSLSHQVSRLAKLVPRGDTTVVDAYLSPVLGRYVAQVEAALDMGQRQAGDSTAAVHAVEWRADRGGAVSRQGRHPARPGRRYRRDGTGCRGGGSPSADRVPHRGHVNRRQPLCL